MKYLLFPRIYYRFFTILKAYFEFFLVSPIFSMMLWDSAVDCLKEVGSLNISTENWTNHFLNFSQEFKQEFKIGDGKPYQGFKNVALPNDREVVFVLGVKSTYEGVTKVSYSEPSKPIGVAIAELEPPVPPDSQEPNQQQPAPVVIEDEPRDSIIKLLKDTDLESRLPIRINKPIIKDRGQGGSGKIRKRFRYRRDPPALVIGLSVAVGVLASLLLLSIFVYFYLKHKVHRSDLYRRGRSNRPLDRQGLTMYGGSTSTIELVSHRSIYVI